MEKRFGFPQLRGKKKPQRKFLFIKKTNNPRQNGAWQLGCDESSSPQHLLRTWLPPRPKYHPIAGGVTALPCCDLWAGTVGRKADTFCHFSLPCDCGHKTWEETVGQTAADETCYLMLASATARDLRDTFLTTFCLCKSFKISWAVTEMHKDTSHPKCLKWRKKQKKKTGKNENSVKDVMSGMYSNSLQSYLSGWALGCSSEPFQVT